ncbi:MAG: hypothetical protein EOP50_18775, partial [Sphingobacteriales bacterium]
MKMERIAIGLIALCTLASCVSSRKYKDALAREQSLSEANTRLTGNVNDLNTQMAGLNSQIATA